VEYKGNFNSQHGVHALRYSSHVLNRGLCSRLDKHLGHQQCRHCHGCWLRIYFWRARSKDHSLVVFLQPTPCRTYCILTSLTNDRGRSETHGMPHAGDRSDCCTRSHPCSGDKPEPSKTGPKPRTSEGTRGDAATSKTVTGYMGAEGSRHFRNSVRITSQ
jgi:hypothetical protein